MTIHFTTIVSFTEKIKKLAADHNLDFATADTTIATRRLENAYDIIEAILVPRGLTPVQISTWSRGEEFQLDIATFWFCKDSGWGGKLEGEADWTTVFNREKELKSVAILDSTGVVLASGSSAVAEGMNLLDINASLGIYP